MKKGIPIVNLKNKRKYTSPYYFSFYMQYGFL